MYQRSIRAGKYPYTRNLPLFTRQIGSDFATFGEHNPPANTSQIMMFHSTSKWKAHLEASKDSNKLIVIDFTASWCGPCRMMEPVLNDLAAKYTNVEFIKIDVDELPGVAEEFKVRSMPTFVLLNKGQEIDKVVGVKKEDLIIKIEKHRRL